MRDAPEEALVEVDPSDRTSYYWSEGKKVPLVKDPELLAVRLQPSKGPLSSVARTILREAAEPVIFIPEYGLQISRVPTIGSARRQAGGHDPENFMALAAEQVVGETVSMLDREAAVDFATPVYRHASTSPDVVVPTRYVLAQFKPEVTLEEIEAINVEHAVEIVEVLDYVPNGYRLAAPAGSGQNGAIALANAYYESGLTVFAHPDFIQKREIKTRPGALPGIAARSEAEEAIERLQGSFLCLITCAPRSSSASAQEASGAREKA
jgi:hypothetical protein